MQEEEEEERLKDEEMKKLRCKYFSHPLEYADFDPDTGDIVYTTSNITVCEVRE